VQRALGAYNIAIVLNDNAKRVTDVVRAHIQDLVPARQIHYSRSLEDSALIARQVVASGVEAVFTGGGDGTVIQFINDLIATGADPLPDLGVLPLGTGNALAGMVSSGDYLHDLESYVLRKQVDHQDVGLIDVEGRLCPFTGIGLDAAILNDYVHIKNTYGDNRVMKPLLQNAGGYLIAGFGRTLPRVIANAVTGKRAHARVTNLGPRAFRANEEGTVLGEYGPGDVLLEGPTHMIAAATTPYYGHGLRLFANALRFPGFFEMRLVFGNVAPAVINLPKVWKGRYVADGAWSLMASHVQVEFDGEVPFQIGGDACGTRRSITFELAPRTLRLLRFI